MIEKNIPLCNQLSVRPCVYKIDRIWSNVSPHRPTSRQQTNCRLIVCGKWHKARFPYFDVIRGITMLAKMTSKNQLTLPKNITAAVGPAEYFDVEARNGQIVLTPVRIQRGDAVRAKLAELDLDEQDIADAVAWARKSPATKKPGLVSKKSAK